MRSSTLCPKIDAAVRRRFLEIIAKKLTDRLQRYRSRSNYGDKAGESWVQADLLQWHQYQNAPESKWSRTSLYLEAIQAKGNDWCIGILSPVSKSEMSADDLTRREQIEQHLHDINKISEPDELWPWFEYVDEQYRNWDRLIPELHRESQQNGGDITDYFVNKFAEPILDDVEGNPG